MRKNKQVEKIDDDILIKKILSKRNSIIFFLLEDKVVDIYNRNIETLIEDNDNVFLTGMIDFLSDTKMLTHEMRERGYNILSLLFFNEDFRNKERVELINKIKGLLNLMPIVDDYVFCKNEYNMFYDITKLDFSEATAFNHKTLFNLENQVNDLIYNLCCLSDEEFHNNYQLDAGSFYYINYILNNCQEVFQIDIFKERVYEILATLKYLLKANKKTVTDFKEKYTLNKKLIRKAKKV